MSATFGRMPVARPWLSCEDRRAGASPFADDTEAMMSTVNALEARLKVSRESAA